MKLMPSSFRLKIALLSGLMTVILMLGSGQFLWHLSLRFHLQRLDQEIRSLGQGNLNRQHGPGHYERFENALSYIMDSSRSDAFIFQVKDAQGRVIYSSANWPEGLGGGAFAPLEGPLYQDDVLVDLTTAMKTDGPVMPKFRPRFETRQINNRPWRFGVMGNVHNTLVLGMDVRKFNADMAYLLQSFMIALPFILLLTGLGSWLLARRAMQPINALAATAQSITAKGLNQRIPASAKDAELNHLITVFNAMMDRLETSFHQATRFSADASHELKTPLARLQAEIEQAVALTRPDAPEQAVYSSLTEEIHRLKAIVDKLLLLSLADAGQLKITREAVNLTQLLEDLAEDCRVLAPDICVVCELEPEIAVQGDAQLLERALQNFTVNAIKFNHPQGRVHLAALRLNGYANIRISNTGLGIQPSEQVRVFERFYRPDLTRNARIPGSGLGLSLSREIIRAHGGEIQLERSDDQLTVFAVLLPLG
jgi:two-component system heavy metal sensor histidine kinase CusS